MIKLAEIKKYYGRRLVLDINSLSFEKGKAYAIIGPNGSGKTTLLRIIAGIEKAFEGEAVIDDQAKTAYLPQNPYIFNMTVIENVKLGLDNTPESEEKAMAILRAVGLEAFAGSKALSLSGGEAQRMAAARTLVQNKAVILLDETAASADIASMRLIEECIMKAVRIDGATVIFTTHNPSQALRAADEVVILMDGKVIEMGSVQSVLRNPSMAVTKEFLDNWRL